MHTIDEAKKLMEAAIDFFKTELKNIRTGRANPGMVENIQVEVYGTMMAVRDIATVSVPEPMQLLISPFDPSNAPQIAKGIETANIGINPILEGNNLIRLNVPPMDGQMREKMIKNIGELCEKAKVKIRQARKEANDGIKSNKEFPEDEKKKKEKDVQELTDKYCGIADEMAKSKESEISNI